MISMVGGRCLQGFEHPFDNNGTADLAVGGLGDDKTVGALNHIVGNNEVTTYGQTVHELAIVGP